MKQIIAFGVITVAALFGFMAPRLTHADFQKVKINVVGMTCEFCERALEKNLSRVPGVGSARAWLDKGIAEVTIKNGAKLEIEMLARAVKDGGLTLKEIEVTVAGRLIEREGMPALQVSGNEQVLRLRLESNEKLRALNTATVTVLARISAEAIKNHLWEAVEIKEQEALPSK